MELKGEGKFVGRQTVGRRGCGNRKSLPELSLPTSLFVC